MNNGNLALTSREIEVLDKLADKCKMDWFLITCNEEGENFVYDCEEDQYMSLREGVDLLMQGCYSEDILDLCDLTYDERYDILPNLLKELDLGIDSYC